MAAKNYWSKSEYSARQVANGMGEALDYLIGIALAVGLVDIARKLDDANAELTAMRFDDPGSSPRSGAAENSGDR